MTKSELAVQPFDCMNYFYHEVQEHFIRELTRFDGHMDETALKRAVDLLVNAVPLLSCCFDTKAHRWQMKNFAAEHIVHLVNVEKGEENPSERLLLSPIDISQEPQLKLILVREPKFDTLCVIINHMVCDGAGFKDILYLLSELYSKCKKDASYSEIPELRSNRSFRQILENFNFREKLSILFSNSDSPKPEKALVLPLKGDSSQPYLAVRHIEPNQFAKMINYSKSSHSSINDIILTAYCRALHQVTKCSRITVPCPVDLRKYKAPGQEFGICHLTGSYVCDITISAEESFEDTLKQVSAQMQAQKLSNACLKGPMLLHLLFPILPFRTVRNLFTIPITSYTNLGIIESEKYHFAELTVLDAYFATAVKHAPYFQASVSTYANSCTLSSCSQSTQEDKIIIENVLDHIQTELLTLILFL